LRVEWHEKGGIVGRGVLIDYVAYAERHDIRYYAIQCHRISVSELKEAALEQGLEFKQGDILFVRSGVTKWFNESSDEIRDAFFADPKKASVGVSPTPEAIAWVWDHHFSAVGGDALAWEHVPYPESSPCKRSISYSHKAKANITQLFISILLLYGVLLLENFGIWKGSPPNVLNLVDTPFS
jgi:kynurenine formamidase